MLTRRHFLGASLATTAAYAAGSFVPAWAQNAPNLGMPTLPAVGFRRIKVGDVEVKKSLMRALNAFLDPMRERRAYYEARRGEVEEMLLAHTLRARLTAGAVLDRLRAAMGLRPLRNE